MRSAKPFTVVRIVWLLVGALLVSVLAFWEEERASIGLLLITFPASLLAGPLTQALSCKLPLPRGWWVFALLSFGLGYLQWFVAVPQLVARASRWPRRTVLSAIRVSWLALGAFFLVLPALQGPESLSIVGLTLISLPASLLASPVAVVIFDFPVTIEGLPFPPAWWVYGALSFGLGYLQWFVVVPRLTRTMLAWHRRTRLP